MANGNNCSFKRRRQAAVPVASCASLTRIRHPSPTLLSLADRQITSCEILLGCDSLEKLELL